MIIENRAGLSPVFVTLCDRLLNKYDKENARYSTTQIPNPPRIVHLVERHHDEIHADVQDLAYILQGQLMHLLLEQAAGLTELAERRFFVTREINGVQVTVGGKPDAILLPQTAGPAEMDQYKYTSARGWMSGVKDEWTMAENIYRYMVEASGITIGRMFLTMIFRDWHRSDYLRRPLEYPEHAIERLPVEPWKSDKTEILLDMRLRGLVIAEDLEDDDLPFCTPEERWQTGDAWAVRKRGNQNATKMFTVHMGGEEAALADAARRSGDYLVEYRKGESRRCNHCFARPFCNQYVTEINPPF